MQLYQKPKTFSKSFFFYIFWIYIQFWTFSKKDDPHNWSIFELTDPERRGYTNV